MNRSIQVALCVTGLVLPIGAATGQLNAVAYDGPVITTNASGEAAVEPNLAVVNIGVEIRAATAAEAAARMTATLGDIVDTLVSLGIPRDSLPTSQFAVRPFYDTEPVESTGYTAGAGMLVTLSDFAMVGVVIDAALASGANDIRSLSFRSRDPRAGAETAIRDAFEGARRQATALATAAGGRLGELVEITSQDLGMGGDEMAFDATFRRQGPPPPIVPRALFIRAFVTARWRLER